jgi:ABC-2 type transport system permease protein
MLHGLWRLTWLEIKIFVREPLGLIGSVGIPVLLFVLLGRMFGQRFRPGATGVPQLVTGDLPIFVSILIALSTVLSLVTIISIYRESGILKRLRATPLRPHTILGAHVLVKLLLTAITLLLMVLAGRRYYPVNVDFPVLGFAAALLLSTVTILSLGFVIAAIVPTARFAQPIGGMVLYPMISFSGIFFPLDTLPPGLYFVAKLLPLTPCVSLMTGIWKGDAWMSHGGDLAAMAVITAISAMLSAKFFRWE